MDTDKVTVVPSEVKPDLEMKSESEPHESEHFIAIPHWLFALPRGQFAVALTICLETRHGKKPLAKSEAQIAALAGVHHDTVHTALKGFVTASLITYSEKQRGRNGYGIIRVTKKWLASGWTRVPSWVFDLTKKLATSAAYVRALLWIMRKTRGSPSKRDTLDFSISLAVAGTRTHRTGALAALNYWHKIGVIHRVVLGPSWRNSRGVVAFTQTIAKGALMAAVQAKEMPKTGTENTSKLPEMGTGVNAGNGHTLKDTFRKRSGVRQVPPDGETCPSAPAVVLDTQDTTTSLKTKPSGKNAKAEARRRAAISKNIARKLRESSVGDTLLDNVDTLNRWRPTLAEACAAMDYALNAKSPDVGMGFVEAIMAVWHEYRKAGLSPMELRGHVVSYCKSHHHPESPCLYPPDFWNDRKDRAIASDATRKIGDHRRALKRHAAALIRKVAEMYEASFELDFNPDPARPILYGGPWKEWLTIVKEYDEEIILERAADWMNSLSYAPSIPALHFLKVFAEDAEDVVDAALLRA